MKEDKKTAVLPRAFQAKLDALLDEGGTALVRVIKYDQDEDEWVYEENGALEDFKARKPGRYVVLREEDNKWLCETRINERGEKEEKRPRQRDAASPEPPTTAKMAVYVSESWGMYGAALQEDLRRKDREIEKLTRERDAYWEQIKESDSESPNQEILDLGKLALSAWQGKSFRDKALELGQRVMAHFDNQPEIQMAVALALKTELDREAEAQAQKLITEGE
jgi:hypothetical protein